MALIAALLGWMFDGAEMGVFSMVAKPVLESLLIAEVAPPSKVRYRDTKSLTPETKEALKQKVLYWQGLIQAAFLIGAATGGVLFGWLGDRVGRVRAMTLSVLTYAIFTSVGGLAGSPWQLGFLRFIAALGMGGEWSLGVALVMEVWPNRSRALMAGLIGAAANVGYFLVGIMGLLLAALIGRLIAMLESIGMSEANVQWFTDFSGWRILMLLGVLPALLTFLIRMFVPESHKWEDAQKAGGTKHWASADLLVVILGIAGPWFIVYLWTAQFDSKVIPIIGTLLGLVVVCFGFTFPVLRYLQREAKASGNSRRHLHHRHDALRSRPERYSSPGNVGHNPATLHLCRQLAHPPNQLPKKRRSHHRNRPAMDTNLVLVCDLKQFVSVAIFQIRMFRELPIATQSVSVTPGTLRSNPPSWLRIAQQRVNVTSRRVALGDEPVAVFVFRLLQRHQIVRGQAISEHKRRIRLATVVERKAKRKKFGLLLPFGIALGAIGGAMVELHAIKPPSKRKPCLL